MRRALPDSLEVSPGFLVDVLFDELCVRSDELEIDADVVADHLVARQEIVTLLHQALFVFLALCDFLDRPDVIGGAVSQPVVEPDGYVRDHPGLVAPGERCGLRPTGVGPAQLRFLGERVESDRQMRHR